LHETDRNLTVSELAEVLRIGRSSALKLLSRPDFPAVRLPGVRRIIVPERALMEWLARQGAKGA